MKLQIEKGSLIHLLVLILIMIIAGLIIYPIIDLLYYKFITNSIFAYSVKDHVIDPIITGVILGIVFWISEKIMIKKKSK